MIFKIIQVHDVVEYFRLFFFMFDLFSPKVVVTRGAHIQMEVRVPSWLLSQVLVEKCLFLLPVVEKGSQSRWGVDGVGRTSGGRVTSASRFRLKRDPIFCGTFEWVSFWRGTESWQKCGQIAKIE